MQILYGNDGINYRTIDKSSDMTSDIENAVLKNYVKYDFTRSPQNYSSVGKEPESITYVTSNLNMENRFHREQLLLCKTGHMQKYGSPSYYAHALIKDVDSVFFKDDFFEIFSYSFIKDTDITKYSDGKVDQYVFPVYDHFHISLLKEQIVVILAMFMENEDVGKKTRIICDIGGDGFNHRSREILYSIYHYLPYEIRKRYGFTTYCQTENKLSGRVSFVIFCKDDFDGNMEGIITLNETRTEIASFVKKEYLDYASYLVEDLDDKGRSDHFETISSLAAEGRLKISDCVDYYSKVKLWDEGTQEQYFHEWVNYIDQNSYRKGPIYEKLLNIIKDKVDSNYYNDYLFDKILLPYQQTVQSLSSQAAKTIRFADCLKSIKINPERFHKWYEGIVQKRVSNIDASKPAYSQEVYKLYEEEEKALSQVNIMSEGLSNLLKSEIDRIKELKREAGKKLEERAEEEKIEIGEKLNTYKNIMDLSKAIGAIYREICFDSNRTIFYVDVDEWIDTNIVEKTFSTLKEADETISAFSDIKQFASKDKAKRCDDYLHEERNRLAVEMSMREFYIRAENILDQYENLVCALSSHRIEEEDEITVLIEGRKLQFRANGLKAFLSFILKPSEDSYDKIDKLFKRELIDLNVLSVEHASFLIKDGWIEDQKKQQLIEWYLNDSPVIVSGIYIADLVHHYCVYISSNLIKKFTPYEDTLDERGLFVRRLRELADFPHNKSDKKRPKYLFTLFSRSK